MYAKVINGALEQYPYTFGDLKNDYPNVSFPKDKTLLTLSDWNVVQVVEQPDPLYDPFTQKLVDGTPAPVAGEWRVTREVQDLTPAETIAYQEAYDQEQDREALKVDNEVKTLLKARPDQINSYIENNVTDLASAKDILKIYGRALAVLAQRVI